MFCPNCGNEVNVGQQFCSKCGYKLIGGQQASTGAKPDFSNIEKGAQTIGKGATEMMGAFARNLAGSEKGEHVDLHLKDCFSDVFKKHTEEEEEKVFFSGSSSQLDIGNASTEWPKPWLYSRVLAFLLLATAILWVLLYQVKYNAATPLYMVLTSLIGPLSVLTFFYEVNVPRNISFIQVIKIFIIGGILSLIATLIIGTYSGEQELMAKNGMVVGTALAIGIVEELAKAIIDALYINRVKGKRYILTCMLIGAAVGAGFSAFETVGYDWNSYMAYIGTGLSDMAMRSTILMRGLTSIGGHMMWSAISGAAMIIASKGEKIKVSTFVSPKYLSIAILPVILHCIWDWDLPINEYVKIFFLIVIVWIIALVLIGRGIREVNAAANAENSSENSSQI